MYIQLVIALACLLYYQGFPLSYRATRIWGRGLNEEEFEAGKEGARDATADATADIFIDDAARKQYDHTL